MKLNRKRSDALRRQAILEANALYEQKTENLIRLKSNEKKTVTRELIWKQCAIIFLKFTRLTTIKAFNKTFASFVSIKSYSYTIGRDGL